MIPRERAINLKKCLVWSVCLNIFCVGLVILYALGGGYMEPLRIVVYPAGLNVALHWYVLWRYPEVRGVGP